MTTKNTFSNDLCNLNTPPPLNQIMLKASYVGVRVSILTQTPGFQPDLKRAFLYYSRESSMKNANLVFKYGLLSF